MGSMAMWDKPLNNQTHRSKAKLIYFYADNYTMEI